MVSIELFGQLEKRVSTLESFHLTSGIDVDGGDSKITPTCVYIQEGLYTEYIQEIKSINIPTSMKDHSQTNFIFVSIYLHELQSKTKTLVKHENMYHYLYVKNFFTVIVSKFNFNETSIVIPKLNTENTENILHYTDAKKHTGMYFGYCNVDSDLTGASMFTSGRDNGIFFVINDNKYRKAEKYLANHLQSDISKVCTVADGKVDIYLSNKVKNLDLALLDSNHHVITTFKASSETKLSKFEFDVRFAPFSVIDEHTADNEKRMIVYAQVFDSELVPNKPVTFSVDQTKRACYIESSAFKLCLQSTFTFVFKELVKGAYTLSTEHFTTVFVLNKPSQVVKPGSTWKAAKAQLEYGDGIYFLINTVDTPQNLEQLKSFGEGKLRILISKNLKDYYNWLWTPQ